MRILLGFLANEMLILFGFLGYEMRLLLPFSGCLCVCVLCVCVFVCVCVWAFCVLRSSLAPVPLEACFLGIVSRGGQAYFGKLAR